MMKLYLFLLVIIIIVCKIYSDPIKCPKNSFICEDKTCIPPNSKCDGYPDCNGGEDESTEACTAKCPENHFLCSNEACIPPKAKCDGYSDCIDGEDESEETCPDRSCQVDEFQCTSGKCISLTWICDNETDCKDDGADEAPTLCNNTECKSDQFTCRSPHNDTRCIPLSWVCDGNSDCGDESDEFSCNPTCTSEQFTCTTGECIPLSWKCDDEPDCVNKFDEKDCPPRECSSNEVKCPGSICIKKSWVCDGTSDCSDGWDEHKRCTNGQCINKAFFCDGEPECDDGYDEMDCPANITSTLVCPIDSEVKCAKSLMCIKRSFICDGDNDCPQGEDEEGCGQLCPPNSFKCGDESCIDGDLRCNGFSECQDGSDERNCTNTKCKPDLEFECGGRCIPRSLVCDGNKDCTNNEDEMLCNKNECDSLNGGCSQICIDDKVGHHCQCRQGFMLKDNTQCEDINECLEPGICSQLCVNLKGDYKCECVAGYAKDPRDPTRCKAMEGHASLLYAEYSDIRKISLDHKEQPFQVTAIVNETNGAMALDFVFKTGMIFWTDARDKCIYKAPIDEGSKKSVVIAEDMTNTDGLAVDWLYNHIYWSNSDRNTIEVADFNGDMRKVLFSEGLQEPRAIAIYPNEGWMFWTDWGIDAKIERAGMDGTHRETIVSRDVRWPNGLTIDFVLRKLYWVDSKKHMISSADFDGSNRRIILYSQEILSHPFSITVFEDTLYWSDWTKNAILKANKFSGKNVGTVTNLHLSPMTVHVYHSYRQPNGTNNCTPLNGLCTHLCLPAPRIDPYTTNKSCACPEGLVLMSDGLSCENADLLETKNEVEQDLKAADLNYKSDLDRHSFEGNHRVPTMIEQQSPKESSDGSVVAATVLAAIVILCVSSMTAYFVCRYLRKRAGNSMNFDNPVYKKTTTVDDVNMVTNHRSPSQNGSLRSSQYQHRQYGVNASEDSLEPLTNEEV